MPFFKDRYPDDWPEISKRIRARSGGKCECTGQCGIDHQGRCNAPNGEWIWRGQVQWWPFEDFAEGEETPKVKTVGKIWGGETIRAVKVVLTVAHLNHNPMDCRDDNLLALCQACHLRYDSDHHKENARATRHHKRILQGQTEMELPVVDAAASVAFEQLPDVAEWLRNYPQALHITGRELNV